MLWGMGGHVIKCGLAPVLLDLMQRGFATAFAMNGAASIHDFEIAIAGCTSEDVEAVLPDGRFGSARRDRARDERRRSRRACATGSGWAKRSGVACGLSASPSMRPHSLLIAGLPGGRPGHRARRGRARTRRTRIRELDAAALGEATHRDFRLFCSLVAMLNDGGVYLNVGSAVVLPEVFLKAVSVVRNLGHPLRELHHRQLRFSAALPAARERGGAAAR